MKFNRGRVLNPPAAGTSPLDSFFLWLGARIEVSKRRRGVTAVKEPGDATRRELAPKVNEIAVRPLPEPVEEHPVVTRSLNLTRRARAMHMRRRGDETHTIAAALGISHGEVELLFKLDRILQQRQ